MKRILGRWLASAAGARWLQARNTATRHAKIVVGCLFMGLSSEVAWACTHARDLHGWNTGMSTCPCRPLPSSMFHLRSLLGDFAGLLLHLQRLQRPRPDVPIPHRVAVELKLDRTLLRHRRR